MKPSFQSIEKWFVPSHFNEIEKTGARVLTYSLEGLPKKAPIYNLKKS